MNKRRTTLWALAAGVSLSAAASAEPVAWFRGLGSLGAGPGSAAWAISSDGVTVVGQAQTTEGPQAFVWTAARGMRGLGDLPGGAFTSLASAVNHDGTAIAGFGKSAASSPNYEAFRWTAAQGMIGLGDLPGGDFVSQAYSLTDDGSNVVGIGRTVAGFEAFRWTAATGMVGLGDLPGGSTSSCASSISPDGTVVVGYGWALMGYEVWKWTASTGMVSLGELPGGAHFGLGNATTPDGRAIVGQSSSVLSGNGGEAFRWEDGLGMMGLGDLPGGAFQSVGFAVSDDGMVVVGQGSTAAGLEAMVWDPVNRMRRLQDALVLAISGGDLGELDRWTLTSATGVSADGRFISGYGVNPAGGTEAFIAKMPRECYPNCDGSQNYPILNAGDILCFLNRFAQGDPYANCDGSQTIPLLNANDFACFTDRFANGCGP